MQVAKQWLGKKIFYGVVGAVLLMAAWQMGEQSGRSQAADPAVTQKTLMHVFAYTPVAGATQADFDAFRKATADMVGKIPGLRKAWVGKLRRPLDQEGGKREYGVAMEFDDEAALDVYANHPAHTEWVKVYDRVRVPGTTTLDILGE
ncbi:MAG: Dabb family protein [Acidobacteria bacterium]|nr:Dabb family protein [Acidobacteriota bacterium]